MDFLFGAEMPLAVRFFFAFVIVLALIGGTAYLVRRFGADRLGAASARGRQPRLAVIDATAVDGRRRLVLIRRDNVEHLLMIGGPTDVVVEPNIVRAAAAGRDAPQSRPTAAAPGDTLARPVPLNEGNMWPLQPHAEPAPSPAPRARAPMAEEPMQWSPEPEPPLPRALRPEPRAEMPPRLPEPRSVEPRSAEPRGAEPRSAEPRMVEPRMAEPRITEPRMTEPPQRAVDPLAGLAAELSRQPATPEPVAPPPRSRPVREREQPRSREREPQMRAPAPAPTTPEEIGANADQNLAEMAQRLEAALRRPKPPEARAPEPAERPMPAATPEPAHGEVKKPSEDAAPPASPPARAEQRPVQQKSVYDSLEQEMASLLGRPNGKN